MKINVSNPNNLPTIDYRGLHQLQGELKTLTKENYQRLLNSIKTKGFIVPFFTWLDKAHKKMWLLDGHQRLLVITKEKVTPYKLPYLAIEAKNIIDAKEKLMVITSQYGTITEDGLTEFLKGLPDVFIRESAHFDALPNIFEDETFKRVSFKAANKPTGDFDDAGKLPKNQFGVIIICKDDKHQKDVYDKMVKSGHICKIVIT